MNLKKIVTACVIFVISITMCNSAIPQTDVAGGEYLTVPYFGDKMIKFYRISNQNLFYTFNLAPEFINYPIPFGGPNCGPNATAIYEGKLFISFDNDPLGGVLIYNYNDIYPTRNSNPPIIISTAPVAGIAIHPVTGDLYVAKVNVPGPPAISGKITRYSKASGYSSAYDLPIPDSWVNYFSGIAFDASNNLWTGDLDEHRLVCFTASSNYDNFYVIGNGITTTYQAAILTGGVATVRLLSAPEGFARDTDGSLWFSNNNDWVRANNPGEGTFGRIFYTYMPYLLTLPISGNRADPTVVSVKTIPLSYIFLCYVQDAKFGGMTFNGSTIYLSDQGNNKVWKWLLPTTFNTTNFVQAGTIGAGYPGFGGLSINDNSFPFVGVKTIGENIPGSYSLRQNYPNPFNPTTKIQYSIPHSGMVKIVVFDALGREVETLVNENQTAGTYEATFNASKYSSGVYFYKITTAGFTDTKRMIMIK
ncbi:T9SS C-terminal target domain-containing protein [bacterium]|nr:MAG: T9SS C-terminal target domain-containing protein [bacterium]